MQVIDESKREVLIASHFVPFNILQVQELNEVVNLSIEETTLVKVEVF